MAGESGQVTQVTPQEGDRVLVSVPMIGFPPGFRLRPGERAVLVCDETGPAVRPLVRAVEVNAVTEEADALKADGQRFELQESTVREEAEREGEPYVVWVVDPGSAEGPPQAIAIRRDR